MEVYETILSRRSTRIFDNKKVERNKLNQIIDAGRFAPSGGNNQSTHFIVIQSEKILTDLAKIVREEYAKIKIVEGMYRPLVLSINASKEGNYSFYYHAPVFIITANKIDYINNIADCACALENMMLMANALDLGSCWVNQLEIL